MKLKTQVKISQVSHLHDARYGAGMGVPLLGVPLDPPQGLSAATFTEIHNWVVGPKWVGELESTPQVALSEYPLDYLQTSRAEALPELANYDLPLILHVRSTNPEDWEKVMAENTDHVTYFLLEPDTPQALKNTQQEVVVQLAERYPIFLGFGLTTENVVPLAESALAGVALQGEAEEKVGYKDFDALADILEALEAEEV